MVQYFNECCNEDLSKGEQPFVDLCVEEPNFDKFQEASGMFKQSFWYQSTEFHKNIKHTKGESKQTLYTLILCLLEVWE